MLRSGFARRLLFIALALALFAGVFTHIRLREMQTRHAQANRFAHEQAEAANARRSRANRVMPRQEAEAVVIDKDQEETDLWRVPDQGLDFAPDVNQAYARLAELIAQDHQRIDWGRGGAGQFQITTAEGASRNENVLPGRLRSALMSRGVPVIIGGNGRSGVRLELSATDHKSGQVEIRVQSQNLVFAKIDHRVAIESDGSGFEFGRRPNFGYPEQLVTMNFLTKPTFARDDAVEDAADSTAERVRDEILRQAIQGEHLPPDDADDFRLRLYRNLQRDHVIQLGEYRVQPEKVSLQGDEYWRCKVSWVGRTWEVAEVAQAIAHEIGAERREPWVKLGLSVGTLIIALLAWLKVDWLVKGHYSFVTKTGFALLGLAAVGLIWSVSFRV